MNEQWVAETPRGYHFTMHNNESYEKLGEIERAMKNIEKAVWKSDTDNWRDVLGEDSWVKYWWLQRLIAQQRHVHRKQLFLLHNR